MSLIHVKQKIPRGFRGVCVDLKRYARDRSMRAGIIGLPSGGKTTIFNVLTHGKAVAGPASQRRLEPNVGVVKVPDARLDFLAAKFNPEKITYATVEFVDV